MSNRVPDISDFGGGINTSGKWKHVRGKNKFLFPVKAMSKVFRARFISALRKQSNLKKNIYGQLISKPWVVYCKQPFFGPKQVIEYLGRYTHKIAISNHHIIAINNNSVSFSWKDYRKSGRKSPISLSDNEFLRRFSLHVLPKGFTRIRHFGILAACHKMNIIPDFQFLSAY